MHDEYLLPCTGQQNKRKEGRSRRHYIDGRRVLLPSARVIGSELLTFMGSSRAVRGGCVVVC